VIPAIILAAGKSTRMGRPKALLPLDGSDTFLTHIVRTLLEAGVDDVVVVVGHEAQRIVEHLAASGLRARFVENAEYERGQLTSLLAGLNFVDRPGVTATLVMLVDVPLVSPATVRAVIDRYRALPLAIVRPTRQGRHGHPLLIDRSVFESLRHADPTDGARPIVRAHASRDGEVEVDDDGAFADIDTPSDYEQVVRISGAFAASRRRTIES
jgi:molybdenum cofactor cytidylyltransferase